MEKSPIELNVTLHNAYTEIKLAELEGEIFIIDLTENSNFGVSFQFENDGILLGLRDKKVIAIGVNDLADPDFPDIEFEQIIAFHLSWKTDITYYLNYLTARFSSNGQQLIGADKDLTIPSENEKIVSTDCDTILFILKRFGY